MTTGTFSASSWTQLTLKLCEVEKEIGVIRLKADERVLKEAERVKMVAKKQDELIEEHRKHVQERLADYGHRLDNINAMADREIDQHMKEKANADAKIAAAELCAQKAEERSRELEKQVKRLYALYEKACVDHDRRVVALRQQTDERVQSKLEESNRLIHDTGLYATQMQAEGMQYMAELEGSKRSKMRDVEGDTVKRSRFKELYEVTLSHSNTKIPEKEFVAAKSSILQDWHESWQTHASDLVRPPDSVTPGFREVSSSLSNYDIIGPQDILATVEERVMFRTTSPDIGPRGRSKDRALSRAAEHQREQTECDSVWAQRPKTAP